MAKPIKTHYRCIHCGDFIYMDPEDYENYREGYYASKPDTCDECAMMYSGSSEPDTFSDADPGL